MSELVQRLRASLAARAKIRFPPPKDMVKHTLKLVTKKGSMPTDEAIAAYLTEIEPTFSPEHMVVDRRGRRATIFLSKEYINHVIEFPAEEGKEAVTMILNAARELVKLLVEGFPNFDKDFLKETFSEDGWGDVASITQHHVRPGVAVLIFRSVVFSEEEAKKLQTWNLETGKLRLSWWKISPEGVLSSMTMQRRKRSQQKSKSPNPKGEAKDNGFTVYTAVEEEKRRQQMRKEREEAKKKNEEQRQQEQHQEEQETSTTEKTGKRNRPASISPTQSPEKKKPANDTAEEDEEGTESPTAEDMNDF